MRINLLLCLVLLAVSLTSFGAGDPAGAPGEGNQHKDGKGVREAVPLCLAANNLSIATGKPSLVLMSGGSVHIPVWSLSGFTAGQSVAGMVGGLPSGCVAVKVEIVVTTTEAATGPVCEDVYRVHLSQMSEDAAFTARYLQGDPVRTALPAAPFFSRTIVLESFYQVKPGAPLWISVQREPADPASSFTRPTGLAMVKVTPLNAPAKPHVVRAAGGYNSWPMIQSIGDKLVCVYSRGTAHSINEDIRAVYARTSTDNGKTWTAETLVANTPGYGEVPVGKGLDSKGAMLLWVRRVGADWGHDLYRTTDGMTFARVVTPKLAVTPIQISDIFAVPGTGLMALWFAGNYGDEGPVHSWGTLTSHDDGATWTQTVVESGLPLAQWPTEPAAVYLGDGKILAIGRTELRSTSTARSQFQMESTDNGVTWTRAQTNIGDVLISTPSLVLDAGTGLLSNYYYQRGRGILRRRVVEPGKVFGHPLRWPASEAVATGSRSPLDAGNANATTIGHTHFVAFYSGEAPDTAVVVSELPAPGGGD